MTVTTDNTCHCRGERRRRMTNDGGSRFSARLAAAAVSRHTPQSTGVIQPDTRHQPSPCPLINPQGGPSVIGPISTYFFIYPFQLDIKTRQFQPANHFHSLPLPMCRYGIYLYHCTVVAECLDLDTLLVLCQQCYIHIASIQGRPHRWGPF